MSSGEILKRELAGRVECIQNFFLGQEASSQDRVRNRAINVARNNHFAQYQGARPPRSGGGLHVRTGDPAANALLCEAPTNLPPQWLQ